ncbi:beta strand repeat-containing protein [Candidatus Methylobacter oryzae]|uniref:DUF4214 domain-containing protein n=1 Tax=Candidatus Methylobacter oryzae TaxID=2497749 RepID=A0ABY3CA19_9GAMM|nr:DUF4214 domain-containing protein [Candidatus Methylobacter oryzae]TRW94631.1 DUF4214 domain-containing protein [Candidatus Methylobacter oryzae]
MATIIGKNPLGKTETIIGSPDNDVIDGFGGIDYIDGGAGTDIVIFHSAKANFDITTINGVTRVVAKVLTDGATPPTILTTFYSSAAATTVDTLINVETVIFESPTTGIQETVSLPPTPSDVYFANYVLTASATTASENANIITYTVKTGTLDNPTISAGLKVNYTLSGTGITAADIVGGSLTGQVTITDGAGTFTVAIAADHLTEGAESMIVTLTSTSGATLAIAPALTISDTSLSPTYTLTAGSSSVNEGASITYSLATTDVTPGTVFNYTLSGSGITAADIVGGSLSGTVTVDASGTGKFTVALASDYLLEGAESMIATLTNTSGTKLADASAVSVKDTSSTPTYSLSTNFASASEGASITYNLATAGIAAGTVLNYTLSGSGITAADIVNGSLSGSVTVGSSGSGTFTVALASDHTTEGTESVFAVLTSASGVPLAVASSVDINDTSLTPAYTLSANSSSVNEGASVTYNLSTVGIDTGSVLNYTLSGLGITTADIVGGSLKGTVTINNGKGEFTVAAAADHVPEGTESMIATLTGADGTALAVAPSIVINDTSASAGSVSNPTYKLSASSSSVNEGGSVTYTLTTTGVVAGTVLDYSLGGLGIFSGDIVDGSVNGSVTVGAGGTGTFTVGVAADNFTEGAETMVAKINYKGALVASAAVNINDTSMALAGSAGSAISNGTSSADNFTGTAGNEFIDGGSGIDTLSYAANYSSFTVTANPAGYTTLTSNQFGTDNIKNIERIHFSDKWFANDISGNAGVAAKVIVAAFGAKSIDQYMALGLSLADSGKSLNDLCEIITNAKMIETISGDSSTKGYVNSLFTNIVGRAPNAIESMTYESMINNGSMTRLGLLEMAATTSLTQDIVNSLNIELLGIPYSPGF